MNLYDELAAILQNEMTSKGYTVRTGATADEVVDGYLNLVNPSIGRSNQRPGLSRSLRNLRFPPIAYLDIRNSDAK